MKQLNSGAKRGNDGELKYYSMKGVKGTIVAKINQGMSSRVKTSAEYANTRLNNAEFGAAGNMAGAICKALTQRWRSITVSFASAKLLPKVKLAMAQDTTHPWGQRSLVGVTWQEGLREVITRLAKNDFAEQMGLLVSSRQDANNKVVITMSGEIAQAASLAGKGITGCEFDLNVVTIDTPVFDSNSNGYGSSDITTLGVATADVDIDETLSLSETISVGVPAVDNNHKLAAVVVVAKPYREINGVKYIAQEYCTHTLCKIAAPTA